MPGFEYDTIVTKVDSVGDKITNELTNKKFDFPDIGNPSAEMNAALLPILGMFASAGAMSMALPMPGNPLNTIAFEASTMITQAMTAAQGAINGLIGATGSIVTGGLKGILNFGKAVLPVVGKLFGVVAAFAVTAYQIWETFDQIGQSVSSLYESKAELEVKVGGMEAKLEKVLADNAILKAGMISLETSLTNQIKLQETKIQNLETEMANLEALIQNNHAQSMEKLNSIDTNVNSTKPIIQNVNSNVDSLKIDLNNGIGFLSRDIGELSTGLNPKVSDIQTKLTAFDEYSKAKWDANESWQINNRSVVTATLTAAALEAPDRPLDQIKKSTLETKEKVEKATEGIPPIAVSDAAYQSAIGAGTAVAAGTVGYAAWKAADNGFKNMKKGMDKLGSMIDLGRILDVMNLIGTLHNAAMLSRDIFETLIQTVDNGLNAALNAFGVKDINDEGVDSKKYLAQSLDAIGKQIFGVSEWTQIKAKWAAMNKIVTTGNTLLWSIRELGENVNNIAERAAENTGKIGNALRRSGVLDEPMPFFPENYSYRSRLARKLTAFLEGVQNTAQIFEEITSEILNIQHNIKEINDNNKEFQEALSKWEPKPDVDNEKVKGKDTQLESYLLAIFKETDLDAAPENS